MDGRRARDRCARVGGGERSGDSGFYVGVGIGEAHNEVGRYRLEDSVVKAFVGFAFNDYFATELAYLDPQEAEEGFKMTGAWQ